MWLSSVSIVFILQVVINLTCKLRSVELNENLGRGFSEERYEEFISENNADAAIIDEDAEDIDDSLDAFDDAEEDEFCSDGYEGPQVKGLPAAVIIGTKKGGTRALLEFLNIHKQIRRAKNEIHFYDKRYADGVDWYIDQMPAVGNGQIALEKTPGYFHSPDVAGRLHQTNNKTKLLLIVRHPVTRLVSDYNQFRSNTLARGKSYPDLSSLILTENGDIDPKYPPVIRSKYHLHIKSWLEVFGRDQIYVVDGDQFISSPWIELGKLETFLGVEHQLSQDNFYFNKTKGFYCGKQEVLRDDTEWNCIRYKCLSPSKGRPKPIVAEDLLEKMTSYFVEHNEQFFSLIGKRFDWNQKP